MKKLSVIMAFLSVLSCNKKDKADAKIDNPPNATAENLSPTTATQPSVETAVEQAIKADEQGIYKQTFVLEKGKTYPFTTSQKDIMTVTAPTGEKQSVTSQNIDEVTFTIDDIQQDIYEMTINFVSKKTSQSGNGKTVVVDTNANAPREEGLKNKWTIDKALVGNQLKMKMNKSGDILSITGFEAIYAKIANAVSALTKDTKVKKGLLEQTKMGFNEKSLKEQFSKNILILPAKGVKVGEQWSKSENMSPDGKVKLTTHYTLKGVENGVMSISVSGGIPKQSDKQTQNGVTHSISSALSQSGNITFNQQSGWINQQSIQVTTTQTESMTDGKQSQSMSSVTNTTIAVNP